MNMRHTKSINSCVKILTENPQYPGSIGLTQRPCTWSLTLSPPSCWATSYLARGRFLSARHKSAIVVATFLAIPSASAKLIIYQLLVRDRDLVQAGLVRWHLQPAVDRTKPRERARGGPRRVASIHAVHGTSTPRVTAVQSAGSVAVGPVT
ncbi:uncharacterized protein BP01DRAFT_135383 [Aspergillus saccharolyticus JOP 1030-1]|uniref:Uncharacterized protein n=1 Tax=Aspergillus saccharolyticus JOP 1030-1 TaxID=1450539 RepID=A0A318ZCQ0_9EURO|nr:hypothetical protein BP01DRAFT_135383 [Aspergillus saccharolyticus JOP 1030-1]PYH42423.1 hypothetical protein BP01DRAFT_135383 [Aspergillus saccharolyticus JOP 1030-1]